MTVNVVNENLLMKQKTAAKDPWTGFGQEIKTSIAEQCF